MRKQIIKRNIISLACIAMICANTTIFASSLSDVLSSTSTSTSIEAEVEKKETVETTDKLNEVEIKSETKTETTTSSSSGTDFKALVEATSLDIDLNDPDVLKIVSPAKRIVSVVCTILLYAITCSIPFVTLIDICYIKITPLQGILGNGFSGISENGGMTGGTTGFGMGPGMGGTTGYGYGRPGFSGGFGGGFGNNNMNNIASAGNMVSSRHRTRLVSAAAMNAVATEGSMGPDGKSRSALSIYARSMIVEMVATPILLTLAISGKLVEIGFKIGTALVSALGGI